jgi:hypothetical protein
MQKYLCSVLLVTLVILGASCGSPTGLVNNPPGQVNLIVSAAGLQPENQAYVHENADVLGLYIRHFKTGVAIRYYVYEDSKLPKAVVDKGITLWVNKFPGLVMARRVETLEEAQVTIRIGLPSGKVSSTACGETTLTGFNGSEITNATITLAIGLRPDCDEAALALYVAHEFGHVNGLIVHTHIAGDLMSTSIASNLPLAIQPTLDELANWWLRAPNGAKIVYTDK